MENAPFLVFLDKQIVLVFVWTLSLITIIVISADRNVLVVWYATIALVNVPEEKQIVLAPVITYKQIEIIAVFALRHVLPVEFVLMVHAISLAKQD